jgi:hypothetical protein
LIFRLAPVVVRLGRLDDPLLEFIAQLIAHELAAESALAGNDQQPAAREDPSNDDRRDLRPLLDRQAGPFLNR